MVKSDLKRKCERLSRSDTDPVQDCSHSFLSVSDPSEPQCNWSILNISLDKERKICSVCLSSVYFALVLYFVYFLGFRLFILGVCLVFFSPL